MPVLADMEMAREVLKPALLRAGVEALKLHGMIEASLDQITDIRVDNFHQPDAVMLKMGHFYSLYAAQEDLARHLLGELAWNWSRPQGFAALPERWLPLIQEHSQILWQNPCWLYWLPPEAPLEPIARLRGEAAPELGSLQAWHIHQVLEHWPYGDVDSAEDHAMLARCLERGISSGWFEGDALVSWALTSADLSLGMMHTLEGWRRQGIAQRVAADLTLRSRQRGWSPYCYVVAHNAGPVALLERLGFVRSQQRYVWLETVPR